MSATKRASEQMNEWPIEEILISCGSDSLCKACLPAMVTRGKGHVVTIASVLGLVPAGTINPYCASKYGVVGFHESLTIDLMAMRKKGVCEIFR